MSSFGFGIATTQGPCNTPSLKITVKQEDVKLAIETLDVKVKVNKVDVKIKAECDA